MSKIIKEGKLPVQKMTCPVCGCEFEYDYTDLTSGYDDFNIFYTDGGVNCPCCNKFHPLTEKELGGLLNNENRCNSDFMEDVKALAKQYGLELVSVEVK